MARIIDRRRFLRLSAMAAAPLAIPFSQQSERSSGSGDSNGIVVVIGAGLAGLRATELLIEAGRKVVLLEASDNPGGRVRTIRKPFDDGLYAEAGPIRIPVVHRSVLQAARKAGVPLSPFMPATGASLVTVGGATMPSTDMIGRTSLAPQLKAAERGLDLDGLYRRYLTGLPADLADPDPTPAAYSRWQPYDRVTWPEWLRSRGASPGAVTMMTLGGDSRELSALYVLRQIARLATSSETYKIHGGMDLLPRAMAKPLSGAIRYNAPVVRLNREGRQIRIDYSERAQARSILAGRVILAIPFSTLRNIEVVPPFSREKERVIEDLSYFPSTRWLLQSRTRFWRESGLAGTARTDHPAETWDCTHDIPQTRGILGATASGAGGRSLLAMSEAECVAYGVGLVERTFPQMRSAFEKGAVCRWASEPWARGAFAVFGPGQMSAMMPIIPRPEGRVHFAGEHTSSWPGWMEGALQSGERAAREVMTGDTRG